MGESENLNEIAADLVASVEALLFVAAEPISPVQLATIIEISPKEVREILDSLQEYYQGRGIRLLWHSGKVQLTSAPEKASLIENYLGLETSSKLSRAALETLAIIAFQQPVTRPNLDAVRGVNSDGVLRSLLNKGLIQDIGRSESPGRPILYGTTPDFLRYFGLTSLTALPPLENSESKSNNELLKE